MAKCKKGYRREGNKCVRKGVYKNVNSRKTYQFGGGGIGFLGLLTLIFITLKLTGYINWSWLWILAPLWIPFAISIVLFLIFFVIIGILFKKIFKRW